jgi:hypothetical protein
MKLTILLALTFGFGTLHAQDKLQIKDLVSEEVIPFVKVIPQQGNPVLANLDGFFELNLSEVTAFQLKAYGYRDTLIQVSAIGNDRIVLLSPIYSQFEEIKVVPGENPAHRIIDQVIANRKKNSPTENNAFQYESYSKFNFTMDQTALANIPADTQDSSLIGLRSFFGSQYLFLMESNSTRQFMPPGRDKETINAYKVSGFNDPMFASFANEMQSFSFYENQFQLLSKTYINPIALGGTRRYLFILEDTTIVGIDTTFTISFRPRKGKNFDGLKGQLFVSTRGFAVEKVIAQPAGDEQTIDVKIIQEYVFIEGKKWFPSKLSSEIIMKSFPLNPNLPNSYIVGKGNTYISDIVLDPELRKRDFGNVVIETAEDAGEKSDKDWDSTRFYTLNDQERKTYKVIDSISGEYKLQQRLGLLSALLESKIPLGYVNLDIRRLLNFNQFEGYRLGAGLETSKKLMKRIVVGGYAGWSTRDQTWKFGGFNEYRLYPKKDIRLKLVYQQDLVERGSHGYHEENGMLDSRVIFRNLFIRNMEYQRLGEVMLSGYVTPTFKMKLIGNYQRIWFTDDYRFNSHDGNVLTPIKDIDLAETAVEITWVPREKVMQLGVKRVSLGSKFPKFKMKYTHGWKGIAESDYDYNRLRVDISQDVSIRGVGKFTWLLTGSKSFDPVPLVLLNVATGTRMNGGLTVVNTFETMLPSSFYSDQQASLFTRFAFIGWKTKLEFFAPQLSVHHAIGYGSMQSKDSHNITFKSMDKGYYEAGLILDGVLISGPTSIGVGLFNNYGYYAKPTFEKNLTFKLSLLTVF